MHEPPRRSPVAGFPRHIPTLLLLPLLLGWAGAPSGRAEEPTTCCVAWFTNADLPADAVIPAPTDAPPSVPGTEGNGVRLSGETAFPVSCLARTGGMIGFWVRPTWNGDDGAQHRLLRIGEPRTHGLLIEKAATGMLRFVMATPQKVTAARSDVSHWRAGEWHHVVVGWVSREGRPIGLPLFVDRVAVAGPVAGGACFPDFETLDDGRVHLGHAGAGCDIDELVFRRELRSPLGPSPIAVVYRDYFRTCPAETLRIDPEPLRVTSDRHVIAGHPKQFGLRVGVGDDLEPCMDFAVRYGQWGEFDAGPFIRWKTTDAEIATVDDRGRVQGVAPGRCELIAEFRGRTDRTPIEVIPATRPDYVLAWVSLGPRYAHDGSKTAHAPGDPVLVRVRVGNYGYERAPAGAVVRFDLLPEPEGDYRPEHDLEPLETKTRRLPRSIPVRESLDLEFELTWPQKPAWVRVSIDPDGKIDELCEANNQRSVLTSARPMRFAYEPRRLDAWHEDRTINHVGSFCHLDWIHAQVDRMDVMLREAVHPTTSPVGVQDAFRVEAIYPLAGGTWANEAFVQDEKLYDGGFPIREPVDPMAVDAAILHEFGHTCLALPDLYGYPVPARSVLLRDASGRPYAGTDRLPVVHRDLLALPSAVNVPCGVGYSPLMDGCHLHLHPAHAGQVQHFAGRRGPRFWGVQGELVPRREQILEVLDVEDRPLRDAAVSVYHVAQVRGAGAESKYVPDVAKFVGRTDARGRWVFPKRTAPGWDDPDTDEVEHGVEVWNPFGQAPIEGSEFRDVAFTPNVGTVEGLLLVKVQTAQEVEFAWLCLTDFNEAYFRGDTEVGVLPLRTSLRGEHPVPGPNATPRRATEAARNLAPVASAPEVIRVRCGEAFTIDGARSHDPEGEELLFRWMARGWDLQPTRQETAVFRSVAPTEPKDMQVLLHVIDGLRASTPSVVRVCCVPSEEQVVVPLGATWRHATSKPSVRWTAPAYRGRGWKVGRAPFKTGHVESGEPATEWSTPEIWLRRRFDLPAGEAHAGLRLYVAHDDDLAVWLNGVLAARQRGRSSGFRCFRISKEALATLRPRGNTLAVHVQNRRDAAFIDVGIIRIK